MLRGPPVPELIEPEPLPTVPVTKPKLALFDGAATAVRIAKLRCVGRVDSFEPKLHINAFVEVHGLGQGGIQVEEFRPDHGIASDVANLLGSAGT